MTGNTKITLSANELELVCNTNWILTKHIIVQKVYQLFGDAIPHQQNALAGEQEYLPAQVFINQPKISKGENYQQLPYVILDYPRYFSREAIFAIRTLFWWGNFFSVTLQLSGEYKNEYLPEIISRFDYLQQNGFWVCVSSDPWDHHFDSNNYVLVQNLKKEEFWVILCREAFVKIAKKIPVQQWPDVPVFITATFDEMIQLLKTN